MFSSTSALLVWTDTPNNETGFKVERSTDNVNFSQIGTKGANVTSYTDLNSGTGTFYYKVRAYNVVGNSGYTNTSLVTF